MESAGASPETAVELIIRMGGLVVQASALFAAAVAAGEPEAWRGALDPEEWRAVLANATDSLTEAAAALRAKEAPAGAFASARTAGEADGYDRGLEAGRRERRARAGHLALVHRAAG
jgi:hypothetical protein